MNAVTTNQISLLPERHAKYLPVLATQHLHDLVARELAAQHGRRRAGGEGVGDRGAERAAPRQLQLVVGVQARTPGKFHASGRAERRIGLRLVLEVSRTHRDYVAA